MNINRIYQLMKSRKLTQKEISDAIGVSRPAISEILKRGDLKVSQLEQIAEFLQVPVSYFFEETTEIIQSGGHIINGGIVANGNGKIEINGEITNKQALEEKIRNYENQIRDKNKIISLLENDIEELKMMLKKD